MAEVVTVERRAGGVPAGLAAFYREQQPKVFGALQLYLGDDDVAAEVTQDVFEIVCRRWPRVEAMDHPGPWVHRVAMNRATSWFRRAAAGRRAAIRAERRTEATPSTEEATELRALILALPPNERAVIVLRYYADLSITETAQVLRLPEGTVKTRTRRGIERLRERGLDVKEGADA